MCACVHVVWFTHQAHTSLRTRPLALWAIGRAHTAFDEASTTIMCGCVCVCVRVFVVASSVPGVCVCVCVVVFPH